MNGAYYQPHKPAILPRNISNTTYYSMKLEASLLAIFALIGAKWALSGPCYNQ